MGWGPKRNRNGGYLVPRHPRALGAGRALRPAGVGIIASLGGGCDARERVPLEAVPEVAGAVEHEPRRRDLCDEERSRPAVLFIQGANPGCRGTDQPAMLRRLSREDVFIGGHEQVMTDTARYADVVLPATTRFEADDVADSYGGFVVQPIRAVIDRVGESRTNDEVAAALAARLGLDGESSIPTPGPSCWPASRPRGAVGGVEVLRQPATTVQFVDTFPFPDRGRPATTSPTASCPAPVPAAGQPLPAHPHQPGDGQTINGMFAEFAPPPAVLVDPSGRCGARAAASTTQTVRVWNDQASIELPCWLDASLRPGVCAMPKGLWLRGLPARAHGERVGAGHDLRSRGGRVLQ